MKRIFFLLAFMFSLIVVKSQNYVEYYNLVNKAEYFLNTKDLRNAKKLYLKAFNKEKAFGKDYYMLARCYALLHKPKKSYKYLKLSAANYALSPQILLSKDSLIFHSCFKENSLKKIVFELEDINKKYLFEINNSLKIKKVVDTVDFFYEEDQKYRNKDFNPYLESLDTSSESGKMFWEEWRLHDSLLYEKLIYYIEENGFPSQGGEKIYIILLHIHPPIYERAKKVLLTELKKGKVDPFFLGMMLDRLEFLINNKECYLYLFSKNCDETNWQKIIQNRLSIGMSIYYNGPRRGSYGSLESFPWLSKINFYESSDIYK